MNKITLLCGAILALAACDGQINTQDAKAQQARNGAARANEIMANGQDNSEQDNIAYRLQLTRNPGQIGFILLLNQAGQPIMYTSVKGKVTSSGKRLTPPGVDGHDCYEGKCEDQTDKPSDEGTYGHSDEYIYFRTVDGQYIQWNGGYLYSDKPFRTNVAPLVINIQTTPAATEAKATK